MENIDNDNANVEEPEQPLFTSSESYLTQGKDLYHQKNYKAAISMLTLYIKLHPLSYDAHYTKAKSFIQLHLYNKALVYLSKSKLILKNQSEQPETAFDFLYLEAQCYRSLNNISQAIEIYDKINSLVPSAKAYLHKGVCHYTLNQKDLAIENYNKAIKLNPKYIEAYLNKAICLSNINKKEEAIQTYTNIIQIRPNEKMFYLQRSYCYYTINKLRQSMNDANKAIEIDHTCLEAYYRRGKCLAGMERIEEAILEFNKVIGMYNNLENKDEESVQVIYDVCYSKGYCHQLKREFNEAVKTYFKCIELKPKNELAYFQIGLIYMRLSNSKEAINYFSKTIDINKFHNDAYFNKAICLIQTKKFEEANISLTKLLQLNPNDTDAYYNRGICLLNMEQSLEAISMFSKVIQAQPKNESAYLNRGIAYSMEKKYKEALCDLNQYFILFNKNHKSNDRDSTRFGKVKPSYEAFYHKALCHINSKNYSDAFLDLTKSISIYPKYSKAHFKKGYVFLLENKYKESINEFDIAIKLSGDVLKYHFHKGMALDKLGNCYEALKCFDTCLSLNENDIESKFNKALCLLKLNDYKQALNIFVGFINNNNEHNFQNNPNLKLTDVYYNIGFCYYHMFKEKIALTYFDKCTEINKDYFDAYIQKGNCYYNLELYDKAINEFNKVTQSDLMNTESYYIKGKCYMELKKYSEAINQFKLCIQYDDNHMKARFRKGFCHIKLNEYSNGLNEFNICLSDKKTFTKNDTETLFYKGICLYGMQKMNMAMEVFDKVIEINGGQHEEAEEYRKRCEMNKFRKEIRKKDLFIMKSTRCSEVFSNNLNSMRCNTISNVNIGRSKTGKSYYNGSNKSTSESGNNDYIE